MLSRTLLGHHFTAHVSNSKVRVLLAGLQTPLASLTCSLSLARLSLFARVLGDFPAGGLDSLTLLRVTGPMVSRCEQRVAFLRGMALLGRPSYIRALSSKHA